MAIDKKPARKKLLDKILKQIDEIENDEEIPHKEAKVKLAELFEYRDALKEDDGDKDPPPAPKKKHFL